MTLEQIDRLRELRVEAESLAAAPFLQMMALNPKAVVALLDALEAERTARLAAEAERDKAGRDANVARYGQPDFAWSIHREAMADMTARAEAAEAALAALQAPAATKIHASDCSRHNAPAYEAGVCDCGAASEDTP